MTRSTDELRNLWGPACTGKRARVTLHGGAVVSVRPAILDAGTAASTGTGVCSVSFAAQALSSTGMTWLCGVAQGGAPAGVAVNTRSFLLPGMSVTTAEVPADANSIGHTLYQAGVAGALPSNTSGLTTTQAANTMLIQAQAT